MRSVHFVPAYADELIDRLEDAVPRSEEGSDTRSVRIACILGGAARAGPQAEFYVNGDRCYRRAAIHAHASKPNTRSTRIASIPSEDARARDSRLSTASD